MSCTHVRGCSADCVALRLVQDCLLLAEKDDDEKDRKKKEQERLLLVVEEQLAAASAEEWERRAQQGLDEIKQLVSESPAQSTVLLQAISDKFPGIQSSLRPIYEEKLGVVYGLGRNGVAADLKQSVTYNLTDRQAKAWLADHHLFWVGRAYDDVFSDRIAKIVDEQVIQQGLSYRQAAQVLQGSLGAELLGEKPLSYWEVVVSAAAVRSRSFGAVESFVQAGIVEVEILNPEDEVTCETCAHLSGKTFTIQQVTRQRDAMMAARTPEEAKALALWRPGLELVGLDRDQLAAAGVTLPPYHGRCRCTANASAGASPPVQE